MPIDLKDKKILAELDKDARQTFSEIAKKVGLSQQLVSYRVQRMRDEGVLKDFVTFINLERLGYRIFHMYLKLKHMTEEHKEELLERIRRVPHVNWLASTKGAYDLIIAVHAGDIAHFQHLQNTIISRLEHEIVDDSMLICIDTYQMPYPILGTRIEPASVSIKPGETIKLQQIDYKILQELAQNARVTNNDLARKYKTSISSIIYRINWLEKHGVIQGYKPLLDMKKLEYHWHLILFKLKYVDATTKKQFTEFLKTIPQTFFIINGVGNWNMQLELYCKDEHEYNQVMNKIFPDKYHKIIKSQEELTIATEHKCVWYPVGNLEEPIQTKLEKWTEKKRAITEKAIASELLAIPQSD